MSSRNYCGTLNNYLSSWKALVNWEKIKYAVWQNEVGLNGTHHIQGYFVFKQPVRLPQAKGLVGLSWHLEKRAGSHVQARDYCQKEPKGTVDAGTYGTEPSGAGSRSDIEELSRLLAAGLSPSQMSIDHPSLFHRHHASISKYWELNQTRLNGPKEVIVMVDIPGTGKSKFCHDNYPDAFWLTKSNGSTTWWDGYTGQETIVIDDFYGWMSYGTILRILDPYQCRLEVKSSFTHMQATTTRIVFTSNSHPESWYKFDERRMFRAALKRRITKCIRANGDLLSDDLWIPGQYSEAFRSPEESR